MKRRLFIALTTASLLAPAAFAGDTLDFKPGLVKQQLDAGKTVFLDYSATWCSTCKAQERRVTALRRDNPDYDKNIVFIRIDWDTYRSHPITTDNKIPRRSTLVMLRGDKELGRVVAGTGEAEIRALLDLGLAKDS